MALNLKNITDEQGSFWIYKNKASYDVMKVGSTHSTCISSFALSEDGYSLAKAYFNYQVKREIEKKESK